MAAPPRSPRLLLLFALAAIAVLAIVVLARLELLVLFGGVLFALVLRGLALGVCRVTKVPYLAALAAVLVLLVGAVIVAGVLAGPSIVEQLEDLATRLPRAAHELADHVRRAPFGHALANGQAPVAPDAKTVTSGALVALGTSLEVLGGMVVVFFVGVYGAVRPSDYSRIVLALTPEEHRERVTRAIDEVCTNLTRWLLGRLVAMLFVGIACAIAFSLLHVPLAMTLALVAGLLTFVEYVGAIVSAVPPFLLALTVSPGTAAGVLVVYTVLHVIEGYVLTPLLARASVRLPPAATLAGQVVMGALVGPLGLTFSTPLMVSVVAARKAWRGESTAHGARETPGKEGRFHVPLASGTPKEA